MSLETMTKLYSATVGSGGAASVTFSNIPQGYTDLVIKASARSTRAGNIADGLVVLVNGLTTGYIYRAVQGDGSTLYSTSSGYEQGWSGAIPGASATASIFGNTDISFANYSGFTSKTFFCDSSAENNATNAYSSFNGGMQSSSAPITSLTFSAANGTLVENSTFAVYGVKNAAKTAGNSIKATGGNIVFDGTYVTHTFASSGAFTPITNLLVDYLVVAGGGGGSGGTGAGGSNDGGGAGGGAGGLRYGRTTLSAQSYSLTIGAGGSAGGDQGLGTNGSDTAFLALTSTGGGRGGATSNTGAAGGSGGGGSGRGTAAGAATAITQQTSFGEVSTTQGNAGGAGKSGGQGGAGGGGGANGAGTTATTTSGGAGGAGLNWLSSGAFYAGGGGGGSNNYSGSGASTATGGSAGAGGGGAGGTNGNGTAGLISTGGGGGGGALNTGAAGMSGGAGGSGVVIIRYKG